MLNEIALAISVTLLMATAPMAQTADPETLEIGKELFLTGASPACAFCHTLQDAGSTGTIGPDLDGLVLDLDAVRRVLREGSGVMPSFADTLSDEQRDAIAHYVIQATKPD